MLDPNIGRIHVHGDGKRVLIHRLWSFKASVACESELGIVPIRGRPFEFIIQRHKDTEVKTLGHLRAYWKHEGGEAPMSVRAYAKKIPGSSNGCQPGACLAGAWHLGFVLSVFGYSP